MTHLHRQIAEAALGKRLPPYAVVHHMDEDPTNNSPDNLVICPNEAYHNLIHMRTEAWKACGNPDYLRCYLCKLYDEPSHLMPVRKPGRNVTTFYHSDCRNKYRRLAYYAKTRGLK